MKRVQTGLIRGAGKMLAAALTVATAAGAGWQAQAADAPGSVAVSTVPRATVADANLRRQDTNILLTLDEAVGIALERNLGLVIERYTRETFRLGILSAKSIFDLNLDADATVSESTSRTSRSLEGADVLTSERLSFNLGLAQLTPLGGVFTLNWDNNRSENNDVFATFNPSFGVGTGVSYRQPLLRNFGVEATTRDLIVARNALNISLEAFEQSVADTIQQVENAYWDLVEAQERLRVAEESLGLAEELHRRNRVQVDVGTLPPLELVRSEANVATRQEDIITSRTAVGNANDRLRLLLNIDQGEAWDAEIIPETNPRTQAIQIDVAQAIRTALAERPEIERQRLTLNRLELDARLSKRETLPLLDVTVGYGLSGSAGDLRDVDPQDPTPSPIIISSTDYFDALDQLLDGDLNGWSVTFNFAYPLQNRAARAAAATAQVNLDSGQAELRQVEQQVVTEVRTASRQVLAAAQQIESAGVSRRLQERNLEAEQKRYENGMSTSFEVTQIQEDLNAAKSREVQAVASYRRALTEFYRSIGQLLEENGVELADPAGEAPTR